MDASSPSEEFAELDPLENGSEFAEETEDAEEAEEEHHAEETEDAES